MLRVASVNLAVLGVLVLLVELAFGGWLRDDPLIAYSLPHSTDIYYDVAVPDGPRWQGRFRRDAWGLRGNYRQYEDVRLVTMGGSTTDQRLLSEDDTWQAVMAARLEQSGLSLTFANAGVDGHSTIGHLGTIDRWLRAVPGLKPAYVLVYAGINDAALGPDGAVVDHPMASRNLKRWITDYSAMYRLWRVARGMVQAERNTLTHSIAAEPPEDWHPGKSVPGDEAALSAYSQRLQLLAGRIRAWGASPIFVTQPIRDLRIKDGVPWVRGGQAVPPIHAFNREMLKTCRKIQVVCIDIAGEVEFERGDFYDALHNTPQGAARLGRGLADRLGGLLRGDGGR